MGHGPRRRPAHPRAEVRRATASDAAELLVLQRCCWVDEALANETLDIPAFHESLDDVRSWIATWSTWCVRLDGRLVGAVRAHLDGVAWDIGRLMVAPDLAGRGLGRWLLAFAEAQAPDDAEQLVLFTGAASTRNLAMYSAPATGAHRRRHRPAPSAWSSRAGRHLTQLAHRLQLTDDDGPLLLGRRRRRIGIQEQREEVSHPSPLRTNRVYEPTSRPRAR